MLVYKHTQRDREKERGRICLIVWPTRADGCTLPKEQCDWEIGPSVTRVVCVLMHVWQCYKSKCYTTLFQSHYKLLPSFDSNQAGSTVNSRSGLNNRHQSGMRATRRNPLNTSAPRSFTSQPKTAHLPLPPSFLLLLPVWLFCNTFQSPKSFPPFPGYLFLFCPFSSINTEAAKSLENKWAHTRSSIHMHNKHSKHFTYHVHTAGTNTL